MQFIDTAFELKRAPDENGVIEGYASVFDIVDNGMDVVSPGAFRDTLGGSRKVRMLWQHNMDDPIGVWDEIREDDKGLYVRGRISSDVQKGAEALALYRMGAMDSLSIGYRTKEAIDEGGGRVRRLTKLDLFEISLVTVPMLDEAVASVKSIKTEREFEAFLREAGYSRREATAITLHGFKGINGQREAVADDAGTKGRMALMEQIRQLQEKTNV